VRSEQFSQALRSKTVSKAYRYGRDKIERKTKNSASDGILCVAPAGPVSAHELVIAIASPEKGAATKAKNFCQQQTAKTPGKPAGSVTLPQTRKPLLTSAPVVSSPGIKSDRPNPQNPTPRTQNTPLKTDDQGLPVLKATEPRSPTAVLPAFDAKSGQGKNAGKNQTSTNTPAITAEPTGRQKGKETITELPNTLAKTADGGSKTPSLDAKLPVPEDNATRPQPKVLGRMGKVELIAQEQVDNKADIGQQESARILQKAANGKAAQTRSKPTEVDGADRTENASSGSAQQKLDSSHVQESIAQAKKLGSSAAHNSLNPDLGQATSPANAHTLVAEQLPSQVTKTADAILTNDVSTNVATQIQEHIHSSLRAGDQQITIRLHPPELGKVLVRFQEQDDQIIGLLEVSKTQTRYEIEQALPQIIRNLQGSGVEIKRLEVVLTDNSEQQAYKDQTLQDGSFQSHSFSEGNHQHSTADNGRLITDDSYGNTSEPQIQIAEGSINMLA
jgi:flagellar hook-length control protein FliK